MSMGTILARAALAGRRVLLVEDRYAVARQVEKMLKGFGCEIVGPASSLIKGFDIVLNHNPGLHVAVLDIDLAGDPVYPLAQALIERGTAIVFATGYSERALPEAWRGVPRVQKPFEAPALERALLTALNGRARLPRTARAAGLYRPADEFTRSWDAISNSRNLLVEIDAVLQGERRYPPPPTPVEDEEG